MAEVLVHVNPEKYGPYMTIEHGKKVMYVQLLKALYGTLQAALLFWQNLSSFLIDNLGFVSNQYDSCVVNKYINGKQCTIAWHVDDLKISHVDPAVVEDMIASWCSTTAFHLYLSFLLTPFVFFTNLYHFKMELLGSAQGVVIFFKQRIPRASKSLTPKNNGTPYLFFPSSIINPTYCHKTRNPRGCGICIASYRIFNLP